MVEHQFRDLYNIVAFGCTKVERDKVERDKVLKSQDLGRHAVIEIGLAHRSGPVRGLPS